MSSRIIKLSDAVVDRLNSAGLSQSITAQRLFRPVFDLEALAQLHVTVVPVRQEKELLGHARTGKTIVLDVCVQKTIDPNNLSTVDRLLEFVDEIDSYLELRELPKMTNAQWMKSEMVDGAEAGYAPEHFDQHHCFTGILRLTYKVR
jgi:hypothetical protein